MTTEVTTTVRVLGVKIYTKTVKNEGNDTCSNNGKLLEMLSNDLNKPMQPQLRSKCLVEGEDEFMRLYHSKKSNS